MAAGGLAGLAVGDQVHVGHLAEVRERVAETVAAGVEREIAHIESIAHSSSCPFVTVS